MYELFEHTADLGLRIRAETLDGLFEEAAEALFSAIVENPADIRPVRQMSFEIEAERVDDLLRDWLAELLYEFHADHLLFADFKAKVSDGRVAATAGAEPVDANRHRIDAEIKAVTYHGLKVVQTDEGWLAEVIVDI